MKDFKDSRVGVYLFIFNGILHTIGGILAIGLLELSATWFIYTGFFLIWGIPTVNRIKIGKLDRNYKKIVGCATISFLNLSNNIIFLLTNPFQSRFYLIYFTSLLIIIDLIVFPIFIFKKIRIDNMKNIEIINYLSIVLLKGLGINLFFQSLRFIIMPYDFLPSLIMIIYIAVFSPLNAYFATRFYSDNKNIKIQLMGFFLLLLGFILGVLVYMIIPNINFLLILILFFIVILLRIFYSSIFWTRYKSKRIEKNPKI